VRLTGLAVSFREVGPQRALRPAALKPEGREVAREAIGNRAPLDEHRKQGALLLVDEAPASEQPRVDAVEEQPLPDHEVNQKRPLGRERVGSTEVSNQLRPPGPERPPNLGPSVDRARAQIGQRPPQGGQAVGLPPSVPPGVQNAQVFRSQLSVSLRWSARTLHRRSGARRDWSRALEVPPRRARKTVTRNLAVT